MRRIPALVLSAFTFAACSASGGGSPSSRPTPHATATPTATREATPAATPTRVPVRTSSATTSTPAPPIPPVSARARRAGLVDVRTAVPDAVIDLRYATTHNFTHVQLYPKRARCLVHRSMVRGLKIAAARLRGRGLVLVFWDCYRPHAVQVRMFKIVPNPNWVARPG